jgi:AsmA protein
LKTLRRPHWIVTLALGLVAFFAIAAIATPLLLSSAAVRGGVTEQLALATGHPVQLRGEPTVTLQPYLGVTYRDVVIGDGDMPVMRADEMKVSLQVLSALWGQARVSQIDLVRPQFNLRRAADGNGNWLTADSPLAAALAAEDGSVEDAAMLRIDLRDGALTYAAEGDEAPFRLRNINGTVDWPRLSGSADADLRGVWNDENISLVAAFDEPLELLRGGMSETSFALESSLGEVAFSGGLTGNDGPSLVEARGALTIDAPAPKALAQWLSGDEATLWPTPSLTVTGDMILLGRNLRLEDARLAVAGQEGTGRLDIKFGENTPPAVGGTLAFAELELPPLEPGAEGLEAAMGALARSSSFTLDLRLSTPRATAAPFAADDVAAGLIVRDNTMQLDVAQGSISGGEMSGTLEAGMSEEDGERFAADIHLSQINLSALDPVFGDIAFGLQGTGNLHVDIFSLTPENGTPNRRVSFDMEKGEIAGLSLAGLNIALEGEDGADGSILTGTSAVETVVGTVFVREGTLVVRDTTITAAEGTATLAGRGDLSRGSLALRGQMQSGDDPKRAFFVGGTLEQPLLVVIPTSLNQRLEQAPTR